MTKKTKMILGVLAVAGIGYYLYNKNKTTAPASSMGALKFDGDYDNASGRCSGANFTQSSCGVCERCVNGQCRQLPPSVCGSQVLR